MKGLILAGGAGSRLYPMTQITTKQLQPVYDKPMIYYPLSFLMLGGIREILLITTEHDLPTFKQVLGNGDHLGIKLEYEIQKEPKGLPEAFLIGENFIKGDDVNLILGDNLFYGDIQFYRDALNDHQKKVNDLTGRVFAYSVSNPQEYGVIEFNPQTKKAISIEEKPKKPKSNFAIPGLYLFDETVSERARSIKPSARGETEIVDLILSYHNENKLAVEQITRGVAWLDTGTPQSLLNASAYIGAIEQRQGLKVSCLEEVALRMNFIDKSQFKSNIDKLPNCSYRDYLVRIADEF